MKILLPLLLALSALPAHAEIYKWTDANGRVHYSDRPQDGVDAKAQQALRAVAAPVSSQDDWRERERISRQNLARQSAADRRAAKVEEQAIAAQKPYNPSMDRSGNAMSDEDLCTRDRQQIEFAEKTKDLAIINGGGPRRLTEAQRQEVIRERKANHALTCANGRRR